MDDPVFVLYLHHLENYTCLWSLCNIPMDQMMNGILFSINLSVCLSFSQALRGLTTVVVKEQGLLQYDLQGRPLAIFQAMEVADF